MSQGLRGQRLLEHHRARIVAATGGLGNGKGTGTTYDRGLLLRLTPYNSLESRGWLPELDRPIYPFVSGWRFDVTSGRSMLNDWGTGVDFGDNIQGDPMPRAGVHGSAVHLALGIPGVLRDALRANGLGLLGSSLTPLIQWGKAWDTVKNEVYPDEADIKHHGWELTVCNIFTWRRGYVDDPAGDIEDVTSGWGVGFRLGPYVAYRYDEATLPQATVLATNVHRRGWTAEVDPLAIWRDLSSKK